MSASSFELLYKLHKLFFTSLLKEKKSSVLTQLHKGEREKKEKKKGDLKAYRVKENLLAFSISQYLP